MKCVQLPESKQANSSPRVEKYRPVSLDDVVSHKDITSTSRGICLWMVINTYPCPFTS